MLQESTSKIRKNGFLDVITQTLEPVEDDADDVDMGDVDKPIDNTEGRVLLTLIRVPCANFLFVTRCRLWILVLQSNRGRFGGRNGGPFDCAVFSGYLLII